MAKHLASDYGDRAFSVAKLAALTGKRSPIVGRRLHEEFPYIEAEVRPEESVILLPLNQSQTIQTLPKLYSTQMRHNSLVMM